MWFSQQSPSALVEATSGVFILQMGSWEVKCLIQDHKQVSGIWCTLRMLSLKPCVLWIPLPRHPLPLPGAPLPCCKHPHGRFSAFSRSLRPDPALSCDPQLMAQCLTHTRCSINICWINWTKPETSDSKLIVLESVSAKSLAARSILYLLKITWKTMTNILKM